MYIDMKNKYCERIALKADKVYYRLVIFHGFNNKLKYNWFKWSDGYSNHVGIRYFKKKFLFRNVYKIIVHDIEDESCVYKATDNPELEKCLLEALEEAELLASVEEKKMQNKIIDFDVRYDGLQAAVKGLLSE